MLLFWIIIEGSKVLLRIYRILIHQLLQIFRCDQQKVKYFLKQKLSLIRKQNQLKDHLFVGGATLFTYHFNGNTFCRLWIICKTNSTLANVGGINTEIKLITFINC